MPRVMTAQELEDCKITNRNVREGTKVMYEQIMLHMADDFKNGREEKGRERIGVLLKVFNDTCDDASNLYGRYMDKVFAEQQAAALSA